MDNHCGCPSTCLLRTSRQSCDSFVDTCQTAFAPDNFHHLEERRRGIAPTDSYANSTEELANFQAQFCSQLTHGCFHCCMFPCAHAAEQVVDANKGGLCTGRVHAF